MALKYGEGFEDDATDYRTKIHTGLVDLAYGVDGRRGVRVGENVGDKQYQTEFVPIDSGGENSIWWHFRINIQQISEGGPRIATFHAGTADTAMHLNLDTGQFQLENYNGGADTDKFALLQTDTWYEFHIEKVYHTSTGTFKVWLNGRLEIDLSGLNTGTIPTFTDFYIGGVIVSRDVAIVYMMDLAIGDGSDSPSADFPYSLNVHTLLPDGNGNSSVLVGSDLDSIDNHLLVDNPNPNEAEFVGSAIAGDKDTYTMDDLASTSEDIIGVIAEHISAKADQGTKFMRAVIRTVSTDYAAPSWALSQSYVLYWEAWDLNPNTGLAWTGVQVNAIEVGAEVADV